MSSADLYEDGFPHGTKDGYDKGCRGSACPGALEVGMTCAQAKARYNGDYGYRKRVDAGMTPQQILAEEPAKPATPKPAARPKPPAPTPLPPELDQWPDDEPDVRTATAEVTVDPTTGKTIPLDEHGTPKGYQHGCRDINCPGIARVGQSCRAAINEYQRTKKRERLERAKAAEVAARDAEPPAEPEATVELETAASTPDVNADELVKVEAFGLDQPEPEPEHPEHWEREILAIAEDVPDTTPRSAAAEWAKYREALEAEVRELRDENALLRLRERLEGDAQRVVVPAGRSVTVTVVVGH